MRISKVKEKFREDFDLNFYKFNGSEVLKNLNAEISLNNIYSYREVKQKHQFVFSKMLTVLIFIVTVAFFGSFFVKEKPVEVDRYFKSAQIDYVQEPVLVTSTYSGEEVRIYKGIVKEDGFEKVQYYYYYNEAKSSKVNYIYFVNRDNNKNLLINSTDNSKDDIFGNLSELINIELENNIEVIIVYDEDKTFSQFFVALE